MFGLTLALVLGTAAAFADAPLKDTKNPPRIRFEVRRELGRFELTKYPGKSDAMTSSLSYQSGRFGRWDFHRPYCGIFLFHPVGQPAAMPAGWVSITSISTMESVSEGASGFLHGNRLSLNFRWPRLEGSLHCQIDSENSHPLSLSEVQEAFGDLIRFERY